MRRTSRLWVLGFMGAAFVAGCGSDDEDGADGGGGSAGTGGMSGTGGTAGSSGTGGTAGSSGTGGTAGSSGTGGTAGSSGTGGTAGSAGTGGTAGSSGTGGGAAIMFDVVIENISATSALPTPFAPGVGVVHNTADPLFGSGMSDRNEGLVALAEDGDPSALASNLSANPDVSEVVVFNTPEGATDPAPIFPGESYAFSVTASPGDHLSLATMLVQSNDLFVSPDGMGIALFDANDMPVNGDVTMSLGIWDVGSEHNEAPGQGPSQAPRQMGPDYGPAEGAVSMRVDGTRAIPLPSRLVEVSVMENGGTYSIEITNISDTGPLMSPIAPIVHAIHSESVMLFEPGGSASAGLEQLAEDGDPSALASEIQGAVESAAVAGMGPLLPGQSIQFDVTPTAPAPMLSFAGMIGQSNDAFLATMPSGVALLDAQGMPRPADDVAVDIRRSLAVWDAGTEANEVPGVGMYQAPRQMGPDTGPADSNTAIRLYADSTNDLADASTSFPVEITHVSGTTFEVIVRNESGMSPFPALITPVAYALHDDTAKLFETGAAASSGLESLSEDGNPAVLLTELDALPGVGMSGMEGASPIASGESYSFQVTASTSHRFLSLATMVVPSNDTFLAFGPGGIALLDSAGNPRSDMDIQADIADMLAAWDAGTEANQASALGPDMAPHQAGPNTGAAEGDGTVRPVDDVWAYPMPYELVRVTVMPQ